MINKKLFTWVLIAWIITTGSAFAATNYSTMSWSLNKHKDSFSGSIEKRLNFEWFENDHKMMFGGINLTAEEKTALSKMTSEQKKAFIDKKMADFKAIQDKKEAVIDKLLNSEALTDADKVIVEQIKKDRAEKKAQRDKMEEIRKLMEKQRNGITLTVEESKKIAEFKATMPKMWKEWKMWMWKRWHFMR